MIDPEQSKPSRLRNRSRVLAAVPVHACQRAQATSRELKNRLARQSGGWSGWFRFLPEPLVRQAATEAEALAWATPYPLLFLPVLVEEKIEGARQWASRQREILERQTALAVAATN